MQADYEKRLKDVEAQREQLLEEMETRENALINEVGMLSCSVHNMANDNDTGVGIFGTWLGVQLARG